MLKYLMHPSSRHDFGIEFSVLARRWRAYLDQTLAQAELTDATWGPLIHLDRSGDGVPQKTLADRIGIDSSTLVRLIDILEKRGLIERRTDAADRRARLLYLTESGRRSVGDIKAALAKAENQILADMDDAEFDAVLAVFGKIRRRLDERPDATEPAE